ncbi:MAG: divergent polysaccharide deacetylase family protein [Proteobacteria bacterium]|nr:divergent polysaccharide deacetylase family protein [Pseudomonadota bacterium]
MQPDDLNAPLGQNKPKSRFKLPVAAPQLLAGLLALSGLVVVAWAIVANNPLGGEPMAVVATKPSGAGGDDGGQGDGREHVRRDGPAGQAVKQGAVTAKIPDGAKTVNIIDGSSGKTKEVVIPGTGTGTGNEAASAMAKAVDEAPAGKPSEQAARDRKPSPATNDRKPAAGNLPVENDLSKLLEKTRYGNIPKIGPNGGKPLAVYAQVKALPVNLKDRPRIAIVLSGVGISASGTADAFTLPPSVTFAIAPYAVDVAKLADRARDEGHELLLQTPMEPFDYPNNDPGPQTLLTSLTPEQNIDRLHWLMSRMQGYVGIVSYMGARFLATEPAMAPVVDETAKRGLLFIDSGASSRSVAGQLAGAKNMPYAKADLVIDAVPTPVEIDRALARLEIIARESGAAIGLATAQPGAVNRIAEWMKKVEDRGFVLVPVTLAMAKTKQS